MRTSASMTKATVSTSKRTDKLENSPEGRFIAIVPARPAAGLALPTLAPRDLRIAARADHGSRESQRTILRMRGPNRLGV